MENNSLSLLPSALALGTIFLVAVLLGTRRPIPADPAWRTRVFRYAGLNLAAQCGHFAEEYFTGFQSAFPASFGLPPLSNATFLTINLGFIVLWLVCLPGLHSGYRIFLVPLWFLALASLVNGVAHPLLALLDGGYFPGLISAVPVAVCGWLLLQALRKTAMNA